MTFGRVPVADAVGAILAHSEALGRGKRLRKGRVLSSDDVADLSTAGLETVVVAQLEPDDIHEDQAAMRLAHALVPEPDQAGLRIGPAGTGRVNLYSKGPGVLRLDPDRIAAVNGIDPSIAVATLTPWHRVEAGSMVATVKIIPYGIANSDLEQAEQQATGALSRIAPVLRSACLIETRVGERTPSLKGRQAMAKRVERLGLTLSPRQVVPHKARPIADAIAQSHEDLVLVLTASATSDIRDTAPQALRRAGGEVEHFGMPVDPGNLLFLGVHSERPVIGLPGCARSPALNGADWVLERVICGVPVTRADFAAMGVGGLLKDTSQRGRRRDATD